MMKITDSTQDVTIETWETAREKIRAVNPDLSNEIDALSPSHHFKFVFANYHYGENLLDENSRFRLPKSSDTQKQALLDLLDYNQCANPVSVLLRGNIEMFINTVRPHRIVPFSLSTPGSLLGLNNIIDSERLRHPPVFSWGLTAGARSLFLLPKISEEISHNRLKKFCHIDINKPKNLSQHWLVFRELYQQFANSNPWTCQIACFSRNWFSPKHKKDPKWQGFYNYLLMQSANTNWFWRNQFTWHLTFDRLEAENQFTPTPYIKDLSKHIFKVSVGALPGFAPANDDLLGPVSLFKKLYTEIYDLKGYQPIIMGPHTFNRHTAIDPVYLSISHPTSVTLSHRTSSRVNLISDLQRVSETVERYLQTLSSAKLNLSNTPLSQLTDSVKYQYFHSNVSNDSIKPSYQLKDANNFAENRYPNNHKFPADSPFLKGVAQITPIVS